MCLVIMERVQYGYKLRNAIRMAVIKTLSGKVVTRGGLPSCTCCNYATEMEIKYDWGGTGMYDLDTNTTAFGEQVGYNCGDSGLYVRWLPGSSGPKDDQSQNGFERINVRVDAARTAGLWTTSYNIECYAGWYSPRHGSGYCQLIITYKGVTVTATILPGTQNGCASTPVATITVYSTDQGDGVYFEV